MLGDEADGAVGLTSGQEPSLAERGGFTSLNSENGKQGG